MQCDPEVKDTEDPTQHLRFTALVHINGDLVGKGLGTNKNQAKLEAHRNGLINVCPQLLE